MVLIDINSLEIMKFINIEFKIIALTTVVDNLVGIIDLIIFYDFIELQCTSKMLKIVVVMI